MIIILIRMIFGNCRCVDLTARKFALSTSYVCAMIFAISY
ncbi:hypothetical protein [Escherichia phage dw-ec]|nr:hypothetical protein [Escherichia phage dw-ec]